MNLSACKVADHKPASNWEKHSLQTGQFVKSWPKAGRVTVTSKASDLRSIDSPFVLPGKTKEHYRLR